MSSFTLFRMDQVEETSLVWLWDRRLARGHLTILEGEVGVGKSSAVFDLVAKFSRGELAGGVTRTLMLVGDHSVESAVLPKLRKAGADLSCVSVVGGLGHEAINVREAEPLEAIGEAIASGKIDLVVIDPLTAFVGRVNLRDETALRAAMRPLVELARRHRVAVLVVVPKRRGRRVGECGVFGVAMELRAVEGAVELAVWRSNLAALAEPLVAKLHSGKTAWTVPESARKDEPDAKRWLEAYLGGRTLAMDAVLAAGELAGHSRLALDRARDELGYAGKEGEIDGRPTWLWVGA